MMCKPTSVGFATRVMRAGLALCLVMLVGCVSTSGSRFASNANETEALRKYTELGLVYIDQGNTVDAMPPLKRALEIDPKSSDAHVAMAMLFQAEKDYLRAEKHFLKALQYSSGVNKTRIRNNYAGFLFRTERLMDACEQLKLASEDSFYQNRAMVYENLGQCYQRLGKKTEALTAYEHAVSIDDSRTRAMLEASYLHFINDNIRLSEQYHDSYQRLVGYRMATNTPKSLWLGLQLARRSSDRDAEASYALKLRNMFPNSPENKSLQKGE